MTKFLSSRLFAELNAGIVVTLVALPLGLGIAMASGYPPEMGLISSVIGGVVVGALSGAPLLVSGAAAGLVVIVAQGVQQFGLAKMGVIAVLAGAFQLLLASLRMGRWFQAVSPTVLRAMLAGIGILIIGSQLHVMIGGAPANNGLKSLVAAPMALAGAASTPFEGAGQALALGVATMAMLALWSRRWVGKMAVVPAALAVVLVASLSAAVLGLKVPMVSIPKDVLAHLNFGLVPWQEWLWDVTLWVAALELALVASTESLLTAGAIDQTHTGPRARYNKELAAQGLGNMLCGFLGALPITGVVVRSSANVMAGAKTRLSTISHGVLVLLFLVAIPGVLGLIPIAVLSAILIFTGIRLLEVPRIIYLARTQRLEFAVFMATLLTVVSVDLLTGIGVGLLLATIVTLWNLTKLRIEHEAGAGEGSNIVVRMEGAATFITLPRISEHLDSLPRQSRVTLCPARLRYMDSAVREYLESWRANYLKSGGEVIMEAKI
jgi:MFS superfamily sulfate permease-like transporter